MQSPAQETRVLPRTIEGATCRYLHTYETHFKDVDKFQKEMARLKSYAQAKIFRLRKKAPTFYEEKLPTLVNQAASALLSCDTDCSAGVIKFHETHSHFLRILDDLAKCQPAGEVDFQVELDREKERTKLKKRHEFVHDRIAELEAMEFDADELGDEEAETQYAKTFAELDRLKLENKRIVTLLAKIEGEKIEEDITFKFVIPPRSILNKLSEDQRESFEKLVLEFLSEHANKKRRAQYINQTVIDTFIQKLNIESEKFTKEELVDLPKELLNAYTKYFRDLESKRRNEYYESLLKNERLLPKEGLILKDPDDITEDVKEKLASSKERQKRLMEQMVDEFAKRPKAEDNYGDPVGEDDDDDDSESEKDLEIIRVMEENSRIFARVKEEPREDYFGGDTPSEEEEVVLDNGIADERIGTRDTGAGSLFRVNENDHRLNNYEDDDDDDDDDDDEVEDDDDEISDYHDSRSDIDDFAEDQLDRTKTFVNGFKDEPGYSGYRDIEPPEDDIKMLGTVAPIDKVPEVIEISDDDD